jgi:predicted dehydrogenase
MPNDKTKSLTRRKFLAQVGATAVAMNAARNLRASTSPANASASSFGLPTSEKMVNIGVVGGGFGSHFQWHLDPNCKVTAVCDLRDDRLKILTEAYGPARTYKSFREFLKHPQLEAVAVFTPAPLHVWMATEAMKAGKHVISAVPAGMSVEELEQLLETVKTTGMKYMMAETSYYRPEIITCREWAQEKKFGTIFYSEAEYHHEGLVNLMFDEHGFPTWRHGFPPMHYPTHCVGMIVPVIGERLVEVQAVGWGDGHEVLRTNEYKNPFWNTTGFFKTSGGHSTRISVFWHVADKEVERSQFHGDRMSYVMAHPQQSPNTVLRVSSESKVVLDANGYPEETVSVEAYPQPDHFEKLPQSMRVKTGHGNSHTFLTHEFVRSIVEDRQPTVNVYEAIAYTLPGIIAHQSALRGGEVMKIKDYGKASG